MPPPLVGGRPAIHSEQVLGNPVPQLLVERSRSLIQSERVEGHFVFEGLASSASSMPQCSGCSANRTRFRGVLYTQGRSGRPAPDETAPRSPGGHTSPDGRVPPHLVSVASPRGMELSDDPMPGLTPDLQATTAVVAALTTAAVAVLTPMRCRFAGAALLLIAAVVSVSAMASVSAIAMAVSWRRLAVLSVGVGRPSPQPGAVICPRDGQMTDGDV